MRFFDESAKHRKAYKYLYYAEVCGIIQIPTLLESGEYLKRDYERVYQMRNGIKGHTRNGAFILLNTNLI